MKRILFRSLIVAICISGSICAAQTGVALEIPKGPSNAPVRFVALGDMGTGDKRQMDIARRMTALHEDRSYDTVIMLGDNIYPKGDPKDLEDKFEKPYAELLRRGVLFYASLGNHDVMKGRESQINYKPFNMGGRAYYSFTKGEGLIEFFSVDSTRLDKDQQFWIKDALSRSKAHWKVVFFHHPIYSSGRKYGSNMKLRKLLEPIFVRYGVDAVFSGHSHAYERTKPQQGIQYFVCGAGAKVRRGELDRANPIFAAGNDVGNSFMYVEVTSEQMAFWAIDENGKMLDSGAFKPIQ